MRVVDDQSFERWVRLRDVDMVGRKLKLQGEIPEFVVLEIPDSAQQQMVLSGDLFALGGFDDDLEEGLWITLWDVWNSWNQQLGEEIVTRLRSDDGVRLTLEQASAQILRGTERTLAVAILCQILYFGWDAWLVPNGSQYLVECSHDGLIWITCRSTETQAVLLKALSAWNPVKKPMLGI